MILDACPVPGHSPAAQWALELLPMIRYEIDIFTYSAKYSQVINTVQCSKFQSRVLTTVYPHLCYVPPRHASVTMTSSGKTCHTICTGNLSMGTWPYTCSYNLFATCYHNSSNNTHTPAALVGTLEYRTDHSHTSTQVHVTALTYTGSSALWFCGSNEACPKRFLVHTATCLLLLILQNDFFIVFYKKPLHNLRY